jgi:hypothetical protein
MAARDTGYYFGLAKEMAKRGYSASRLSSEAKINNYTLNRVLAGKQPVSAYTVAKILQAFNGFSSEHDRIEFDTVFVPSKQIVYQTESLISKHSVSGISAIEFAALGLTNAYTWDNAGDDYAFRLITSKDAYFYLPAILRMLNSEISENEFVGKLEEFKRILSVSFTEAFIDPIPSIPILNKARDTYSTNSEAISWNEVEAAAINNSLRNLYDSGLIVDPILETVGTIAIATLGIVPTSFTKRTVEGDVVYRKISALLWEYEIEKEEEKEMRRLHFRAEKIVGIFKEVISQLDQHLNKEIPKD